MNRKIKEKIKELQIQWFFVVLGALLAIIGGILVDSLYELLKSTWSPLKISLWFGLFFLFLLRLFTFLFENIESLSNEQTPSSRELAIRYLNWEKSKIKEWSLNLIGKGKRGVE